MTTSESIFEQYPDEKKLLAQAAGITLEPVQVNGHFHTPYSFSAFWVNLASFWRKKYCGLQIRRAGGSE